MTTTQYSLLASFQLSPFLLPIALQNPGLARTQLAMECVAVSRPHNSQFQAHDISSGSVERWSRDTGPAWGRPRDRGGGRVTGHQHQRATRRRNVSVRSVLAGEFVWDVACQASDRSHTWCTVHRLLGPNLLTQSDVKSRRHHRPRAAATDGPWATTGSRSVWQLNDIMTSPLMDKSIISFDSNSYFVFRIFFLCNKTQSRKFHLNSFACMLNRNARTTSLDYYSWVLISKWHLKLNSHHSNQRPKSVGSGLSECARAH